MSDDFLDTIREMGTAYSQKSQAAKIIAAEWSKICDDIIKPVFQGVISNLSHAQFDLSIKEERHGELILLATTIPLEQGVKKLSYRLMGEEGIIAVKTIVGIEKASTIFLLIVFPQI